MEIGAHTVHHRILSTLTASDAEFEISEGRRHLQSIVDAPVELSAYPNGKLGLDYNHGHVSLVKKLAFRGAVSTAPGVGRLGDVLFQLPRFTPWGMSLSIRAAHLFLNQRNTRFGTASPNPELRSKQYFELKGKT